MLAVCTITLLSCEKSPNKGNDSSLENSLTTLGGVARMLASLPIEEEQISEVWNAVNSSISNGYDEEYMMRDLIGSPGAGVGEPPESRATTRAAYGKPLRDLIAGYIEEGLSSGTMRPFPSTKGGSADEVDAWLDELSSSGMQIYWPFADSWDGEQKPLITFDPGFGATSNFAYEISWQDGAFRASEPIYVDENVAASRPVWVINRNDDSEGTPYQLFARARAKASGKDFDFDDEPDKVFSDNNLLIKDFTMLRQYDSWFCGASEFYIQAGSVYAKYSNTEVNPGNFSPEVTQLMIVVRRGQVKKKIQFEALLLSGFPDELEQIALLVTESDGGTRSGWKCSAKVMIKSKSYGVDMELPFESNDDMVWRGAVSMDYLRNLGSSEGRFGDVRITFEVQ